MKEEEGEGKIEREREREREKRISQVTVLHEIMYFFFVGHNSYLFQHHCVYSKSQEPLSTKVLPVQHGKHQ